MPGERLKQFEILLHSFEDPWTAKITTNDIILSLILESQQTSWRH